MAEYIHKDILKQQFADGDTDVPGVVQLRSRVSIKIVVYCTNDTPVQSRAVTEDRLMIMLRDGLEGHVFDTATRGVTVCSTASSITYYCNGEATQEVLVGCGDAQSAQFPALDMALLTMRKGETSIFAARRRYGYSESTDGDVLFRVEVVDVQAEVDVVPFRRVTKHIVHRSTDPKTDAFGFQSPIIGSTVTCTVIEMHRYLDKKVARTDETVVIGGQHPEWLQATLMTMQAGELATVWVADTDTIYKLRLATFVNVKPPATHEELLCKVNELKSLGNDAIVRRESGVHHYRAALEWLKLVLPTLSPNATTTTPQVHEQLQKLEALLESNLAQAYLNDKQYEAAEAHATIAITRDPSIFKALFRRAKARKALRQFQNASLDLTRCQIILEELKCSSDAPEWREISDELLDIEIESTS